MKLEPWEPDLRTLFARIEEGELDLQPEFQRGLAWPKVKQQRLIDTVLRGWAIPPLHLLVLEGHTLAVLDGQQRLRALHLFLKDNLKVGTFEPHDFEVELYRNKRFTQLPPDTRRRILNHKIPCYRLYDYEPEEPYELFFRLNLPTGLTQAEKRNALFGPSRAQVKELVEDAKRAGWGSEILGFANARLAYDDIIARACVCVEQRTLRVPLTAAKIESYYRSPEGFAQETIEIVGEAVTSLARVLQAVGRRFRLNKATLLTWLLVVVRDLMHELRVELAEAMTAIEVSRGAQRRSDGWVHSDERLENRVARGYLSLYNDRASLRVTDVLSVVARDVAIWRLLEFTGRRPPGTDFERLSEMLRQIEQDPLGLPNLVLELLEDPETWGGL